MMKNIRSHYIIKFIFSFVEETIKLDLIKYNKNLQNKLDINLINYKLLSEKYIVYESNMKVKDIYYL